MQEQAQHPYGGNAERKRSWLAFILGLFFTIWGLSHLISGKGGGGLWFVAWLISMGMLFLSGGLWIFVHLPVSVIAAWVGSR